MYRGPRWEAQADGSCFWSRLNERTPCYCYHAGTSQWKTHGHPERTAIASGPDSVHEALLALPQVYSMMLSHGVEPTSLLTFNLLLSACRNQLARAFQVLQLYTSYILHHC